MKSTLFHIAHSIKANYPTFAEALKMAWKTIKLRMQMKRGVVHFAFTKVDGTIRKAIGTLNDVPASTGTKAPNYSVFVFWDVEKCAYRSARVAGLFL